LPVAAEWGSEVLVGMPHARAGSIPADATATLTQRHARSATQARMAASAARVSV
jgi:hypothetical protein